MSEWSLAKRESGLPSPLRVGNTLYPLLYEYVITMLKGIQPVLGAGVQPSCPV